MDAPADAAIGKSASYTYWVREATCQAEVPRKLTAAEGDSLVSRQNRVGSAWNQLGTWEEKNLNSWAIARLKEMLLALEPIEYADGSARVTEVVGCSGDATVVTVRNKKRIGYSFDITLGFQGSLLFDEFKDLTGTLKFLDASCGELDDLQIEVDFTKDEGLPAAEKNRLAKELESFLPRIRETLLSFEHELKDR
ncbi:hypothetical protein SELMODRAFT_152880 [Selaginella moellendorffii]|uniref:Activator of Hsp90 ATPase AHSA1-like N-terminal domain-containing protein n=1 Tax=Selaginella moellendorffii TaxID=88036 RepID=D8S6K6_SELML|nr:uncharacterized protein LOC9659253 [Selaginella moellendorffii]XP_002990463.1 uncharacterized protein LOC9631238 [Selaginella moellendorffii]EFJ08556.1 hypothetical protein SELMODRAFT_160889 [Selaginella moellendorffii]EFJ19962.1 hypothetical protein SELMODRAFT_152880 [Selaginella moellendorffii]|eukprot:XP_002979005.1 uncharacterized protein LOC9659253 [Selaginella moellendorffii]